MCTHDHKGMINTTTVLGHRKIDVGDQTLIKYGIDLVNRSKAMAEHVVSHGKV